MRRGLERRRLHLERLVHNKAFTVTPNKIRDLEQRFDEATLRMSQAMRRFTSEIRHRERVLTARLNALDLRRIIRHKREILARMYQGLTLRCPESGCTMSGPVWNLPSEGGRAESAGHSKARIRALPRF